VRRSIRFKLILSIVGPLLLISAVVMWLTVENIYDYAVQQLNVQSTQLVKNYATGLDERFKSLAQVAHDTAAFLQITDKLDEELLYALLRENVRRNPMIYGSAIAYDEYQYDSERLLFSPSYRL